MKRSAKSFTQRRAMPVAGFDTRLDRFFTVPEVQKDRRPNIITNNVTEPRSDSSRDSDTGRIVLDWIPWSPEVFSSAKP